MTRTSILAIAAAAVLLGGCRRDADAPVPADSAALAALATRARPDAGVLRVDPGGGEVRLYAVPELEEEWVGPDLPAFDSATGLVGVDAEQARLYLTDRKRALVSLDLAARQIRRPIAGVSRAVVGPDGTVYAVDTAGAVTALTRRNPARYGSARLPARPAALHGRIGGGLVAVLRGDSSGVSILGPDGAPAFVELPAAPTAATHWGDLVAVGTDSVILLYQTTGKAQLRRTAVRGPVRALTFSPSGHRLYVVRPDEASLLVVDRYGGEVLSQVALPGPAAALRADHYGDWLLVRAAGRDSVWVVDVAKGAVAGGVSSAWAGDLPAVAGRATLLVRRGKDVVAHDLSRDGLPETGRVEGGAGDRWLPIGWRPEREEDEERDALAAAGGGTEPGPGSDSPAAGSGELADGEELPEGEALQPVYLQVSSSQNPAYARELGRQLRQAGLEAGVLAPRDSGDPHRVVVGPYRNRAQAEEASRRLNRPSFIIAAEPGDSIER